MPATGRGVFDCLPDELLVRILHFCRIKTILRFAMTCKSGLELVETSVALQLHIELEANGLEIVDGSAKGNVTYPVILDELRRYNDAWFDLDIKPPVSNAAELTPDDVVNLQCGVYIREFFSVTERIYCDSVHITPLASSSPARSVRFHCDFQKCIVDISQELALLVRVHPKWSTSVNIHICSTVTGLSHPLAKQPLVTVELDFNILVWEPHFTSKIMGDVVVTKFASPTLDRREILIWTWSQGAVLHRINLDQRGSDFTFLDKQYLVLSSAESNSKPPRISLLAYDIFTPSACSDRTLDGHFDVPNLPILDPILRLDFPNLHDSVLFSAEAPALRSRPAPGQVLFPGSVAFSCSHTVTLAMSINLFTPKPVTRGGSLHHDFRVIINGDRLLDHIHHRLVDDTTGMVILTWSEWGEKATRWFLDKDGVSRWVGLFGSRQVVSHREQSPHLEQTLAVVDFNTLTTRRHADRISRLCSPPNRLSEKRYRHLISVGDGLATHRQLRIGPSFGPEIGPKTPSVAEIIADDAETVVHGGFVEPVTSRLPYRIVTRAEPVAGLGDWAIESECLVRIQFFSHSLAFGLNFQKK